MFEICHLELILKEFDLKDLFVEINHRTGPAVLKTDCIDQHTNISTIAKDYPLKVSRYTFILLSYRLFY